MTIAQPLIATAHRVPDKEALVVGKERLTYAEMAARAASVAVFLTERGVRPGDRVVILLPNGSEAVAAIYGASWVGAAFVPLSPQTRPAKLRMILAEVAPTAIIVTAAQRALWEPVLHGAPGLGGVRTVIVVGATSPAYPIETSFEEVVRTNGESLRLADAADDDVAAIIYTSGTTSDPKGVTLTQLNMVSAATSVMAYLPMEEHDRVVSALPLFFGYGLYQVLMGFWLGATVILETSFAFPAKSLEVMVRERVTVFPGVPTMYALLLGLPTITSYDLSSLRILTNAAAALPLEHLRRIRGLWPHARFYSMYGQTECKRISYLPPEELDRRPDSVGRGMPNQELWLIDDAGRPLPPGNVGELVVSGPHVMLGYWRKPEETARKVSPGRRPGERLLYTGDLFRQDEAGYLYFVARMDDVIKTRGERVSPREVENALTAHADVAEAAVIGVADPLLGEAVKAFVVLRRGADATLDELRRFSATQLEPHMVPKYIAVVDELPLTDSGKVKKSALPRTPT